MSASSRPTETDPSALPADRFINRELSWLEFNQRVLDQAADGSIPPLERAKFLAITSSNLDEFTMVRIGSLKLQHERNATTTDPSGLTVVEQLEVIARRCSEMVARQYRVFKSQLEPLLREADIHHVDLNACSDACAAAADQRFHGEVISVLSPQMIFLERPFPLIQGLSIHLCVRLKRRQSDQPSDADGADEEAWEFAIVPLGRALPRMMPMPADRGHAYVLLEELVAHYIDDFFPGREVVECTPFRITRNADVELQEDAASDLLEGMEDVLESRRQSRAVRLEYRQGASDALIAFLSEKLDLRSQDLYPIDGPLDLTYLFQLHGLEGYDAWRDPPWPPQSSAAIDSVDSMFANISGGDILLVHPYERFDPVVRLIEEAAVDPDVLSIKQVLYRTSRNSPIVEALMRAARGGKYVSVIVELKARFDEARNIEWAREMERAGVQVIYGIRGLKTHAKVCIIVRRESQGIVRYMHFGTGNYNEVTAKLYGDISLLTCNDGLGADATTFFNGVTGASELQQMNYLAAAPVTLRQRVLDLIDAETRRCQQGQRAEIVVKLNAVVDTEVIDALYQASQQGVKIDLNVRGICCLRPQVPGLSETVRVVSIVDRYLEHARILYFRHGGNSQLFISSADWMPRNLDRRVELLVPVHDEGCRRKLLATLRAYFQDNMNAWEMASDGSYRRLGEGDPPFRVQAQLYRRACEEIAEANQGRRARFEPHFAKENE